jgi:hypothetical protein
VLVSTEQAFCFIIQSKIVFNEMKKVILSLMIAFAACTAQAQQTRPFVYGGFGAGDFWLENADGVDPIFAYNVGVGLEVPFNQGNWGFQPALQFISKGGTDEEQDITMRLSYLEVPLDFYYKKSFNATWGYKIAFGPYLGYGITGDTTVKNGSVKASVSSFGDEMNFRRFDVGLNLQALMTAGKLFFGFNYDFGFIPLHEKVESETFPCSNSSLLTIGMYF